MAITLPLPVRVAAGILGAGIDLLRALPDDIPAIPVTIVGNAMRLSMKVQQEIASLATRGDELLGGVIGAPQESPAWAKFDDDEPVKPATPIRPAARAASGSGTKAAPKPGPAKAAQKTSPDVSLLTDENDTVGTASTVPAEPATSQPDAEVAATLTTPETTAMPPVTTTAIDAAIEVPQSVIDAATEVTQPVEDSATVAEDADVPPDADPANLGLADTDLADDAQTATEPAEDGTDDDRLTGTEPADLDLVETELIEAELIEAELIEAELIEAELIEAEPAVATQSNVEQADAGLAPVATGLVGIDDADALRAALPSELTDGPEAPVIFGETDELTEGLPIPEELIPQELIPQELIPQELIQEVEAAADGPTVLPDYDRMTLAQVRGHLRELSSDDVSALLRYEQDGDNRAPFLTLLSNRLVTLDAQHS